MADKLRLSRDMNFTVNDNGYGFVMAASLFGLEEVTVNGKVRSRKRRLVFRSAHHIVTDDGSHYEALFETDWAAKCRCSLSREGQIIFDETRYPLGKYGNGTFGSFLKVLSVAVVVGAALGFSAALVLGAT